MPPKKDVPQEPEVPAVLQPDDFVAAVVAGFESGDVEKIKEELNRLCEVPNEERHVIVSHEDARGIHTSHQAHGFSSH